MEHRASLLRNQSIVSFSQERWSHVLRSRHHIMAGLARGGNKVLFASSPTDIRNVFHDSGGIGVDAPGTTKVSENLHAYVPPNWLPTNYRFPRINHVVEDLRDWHLRRTLRHLAMDRPIYYVWHPSFANLIRHFDDALVVYHCYDEYNAFTSDSNALLRQRNMERQLLQRANVVFTVSEAVRARRLAFNKNIHVVTNGVDFELFSRAQDPHTAAPDDMAGLVGPIIGLVGTQTVITDLKLLRAIFEHRRDWNFVFIGLDLTAKDLANEDMNALRALPNVRVIGRRAIQQIPGYLKACDIYAIPWVLNDISLSGSPLKLYEYLAAGKPVICTPLNHLLFLSNVIAFAATADDWIAAIDCALRGDGPGSPSLRQEIARQNSWDSKVDFISTTMSAELEKLSRQQLSSHSCAL